MAEAINRAERSLTTAQATIETLKTSAKESNDIVFKKALQQLVTSLDQGSQALSKIEELQKAAKGDGKGAANPLDAIQQKVKNVMQTVGTLDQDPDVKEQVVAAQNSMLWAELQNYKTKLTSKHDKLETLRRGKRVENVEHDTQG